MVTTANCSNCHLTQRPATHTANATKYPVTCQSCHRYTAPWTTVTHVAATVNCSNCHLTQRPTTHTGNTAKYPATCESCHSTSVWSPVDLHAPDDGRLLELPPHAEACDAHGEPDSVPDYLLELPQVPCMGDDIAYRHDD